MMNENQRKELALVIVSTAIYFGRQLERSVVALMVSDLEDLDFEKVISAYSIYRRDGKNSTFPLPGKIREMINPKQSKDGLANEAASRIRKAISDFGWCNSEEAKAFIGELGWAVVERSGGWQYVCENHGLDLNPLTFHAQARDLAKSIAESSELGIHDQPIALPENKNKMQIDNILKLTNIKEIKQ